MQDQHVVAADWGRRWLANLIDPTVGWGGGLVAGASVEAVTGVGWIGGLVWIAIVILYPTLMEASDAQAPYGKIWLKLVVKDENGVRLSLGRSFWRNVVKQVLLLVALVDVMPAFFNSRRQTIHDLLSSTVVRSR
jgi:uncharacterized RDD family membrane protein YckC